MPQDTEVISCPACSHLVRVPVDWLGQPVQCPECRAMFRAPIRDGDSLSAPELLSRPEPGDQAVPRKKWDVMLLLPALGLLLCGAAGSAVNGVLLSTLLSQKDNGREWTRNQVRALHKMGVGEPSPPEARDQKEEAEAEAVQRVSRVAIPISLALSIGAFAGGLSIAFCWNYRLAQVGCLMAVINLVHCCCVPGTVAGVWGLLMLGSEEGRRHFGR